MPSHNGRGCSYAWSRFLADQRAEAEEKLKAAEKAKQMRLLRMGIAAMHSTSHKGKRVGKLLAELLKAD